MSTGQNGSGQTAGRDKYARTFKWNVPTGANDEYKAVKLMASGAGAGAITKTSIAPLERIKILFQVQAMKGAENKYTGIVQAIRTIVREEGVWALYYGNGANIVRVIPVYALKFTFNDTFRVSVLPQFVSADPHTNRIWFVHLIKRIYLCVR